MPLYDYTCTKCGHSFEKFLSISDRNLPESDPCPNCSETNCVQKCMSVSNAISPFRLDGLKKPPSQFKERMQQIKIGLGKQKHNLKDHY